MRIDRRTFAVATLALAGLTACGSSGGSGSTAANPAATAGVGSATSGPIQPSVAPTTLPPPASTAPNSTAPSPASTGAAEAGAACGTSQLGVRQTEGQGAAGTEYSGITFTNRSGSTCTLQGYPGVSLLDAQRRQMGQPATRVHASDPVVVLAPGQSATASFSVSPAACASSSLPAKSAYLRVFPPGQRADVVVTAQVFACAPQIRPVHQGATITP